LKFVRNIIDGKINQKYYVQSGVYTICAVKIKGVLRYELWEKRYGIARFIATDTIDNLKKHKELK
jgi:hypothetical protein